jgi:hypothetical protein
VKKLIFILAALLITNSSFAQMKINGGADVGASFILNPDKVTSEQIDNNHAKWTPNLLNTPVTDWCVTKDGTAFKTLKKVRACQKVAVTSKYPQGVWCRDANLVLERERAIPTCSFLNENGECRNYSWAPAPQMFEIVTVEEMSTEPPTVVNRIGFYPEICK